MSWKICEYREAELMGKVITEGSRYISPSPSVYDFRSAVSVWQKRLELGFFSLEFRGCVANRYRCILPLRKRFERELQVATLEHNLYITWNGRKNENYEGLKSTTATYVTQSKSCAFSRNFVCRGLSSILEMLDIFRELKMPINRHELLIVPQEVLGFLRAILISNVVSKLRLRVSTEASEGISPLSIGKAPPSTISRLVKIFQSNHTRITRASHLLEDCHDCRDGRVMVSAVVSPLCHRISPYSRNKRVEPMLETWTLSREDYHHID